jgi:hypothetical protein
MHRASNILFTDIFAPFHFPLILLFFWGGGVYWGWNPGLELARQALYHLSPAPTPFFTLVIFLGRASCFCLDCPRTMMLLHPPPQ